MKKYKICPSCGAHNDPTAIECIECEEDLTTVKIVDEDAERAQKQKEEEAKEKKASAKKVKICYCGAKNPSNARKCLICGDDISMIIPSPDLIEVSKTYSISSLDGSYSFKLKKGLNVLGREKDMKEYLGSKMYVSRTHAEITVEEAKVYIKSLGTNHSFVNNTQIPDNETVEIKPGDEIYLGGNDKNGVKQPNAAYLKLENK